MILRKRYLACVTLITCMPKPPMAKKVWTELKVASIRIQPPPVHLHVRIDVVGDVDVKLELQGGSIERKYLVRY